MQLDFVGTVLESWWNPLAGESWQGGDLWSLRLIGKSALAQESDEGQVKFANFSLFQNQKNVFKLVCQLFSIF